MAQDGGNSKFVLVIEAGLFQKKFLQIVYCLIKVNQWFNFMKERTNRGKKLSDW